MVTLFALVLAAAPPPTTAPPRNVYVGVHLNDVSDFDLKAGRFKADVVVWVKWLGIDDAPALTFPNAEIGQTDDLGIEVEGHWHAKRWRLQGTFRGDFPVHDFPFDEQSLRITFALQSSEGVLVPDLAASGMSTAFSITGWNYEPYFSASATERVLGSDLGSVSHEGQNAHQRLVTYAVELSRPFGPYLVKFALPLVLILLVSLLALFLQPERLDVRSAMGITGLLSCIAFHFTHADTLPAVTYLVAADTLFLASYIFITLTLVLSVVVYRVHEQRPQAARLADRLGVWLLPVTTLAGLWLAIAPAFARHVEVEPVVPPNPFGAIATSHVSVATLDQPGGAGLAPLRRCALVTKTAEGTWRAELAVKAPAMTNELVRLLPDGGMRVRWRLREGARWSDGTFITIEDLLSSLAAQPDPLRTKVETVDARTVDVFSSDRRSEALAGFFVYPARAARTRGLDGGRDALNQALNEGLLPSCGPYVIEAFDAGTHLVLSRNPHLATTPPAIERIDVTAMAPLDAAHALLDGRLDIVTALTPDARELLQKDSRAQVLEQPGDQAWMLVPRLSEGPFADVEARRALLAAIDRPGLVKALAPLPTHVADGWSTDGCERGPDCPSPPPAKSLAELGLVGTEVRLTVPTIRSKDATHAVLTERLVFDLTRAGLTVQVVEKSPTELRAAIAQGTHEGLSLLSRDSGDPGRFMNVPGEAGRALDRPFGAHFDAELLSRLTRFRSTLYAERRDELEAELQAAWFVRLPMLPLLVSSRVAAVRADLLGPRWGKADSVWWNIGEWHVAPNAGPSER
jgi:ABC-type transport system substrate-binding protein